MTQVNARVNLDFKEPNGVNVSLHRNISASIDQKGQLKKREQDVTITRSSPNETNDGSDSDADIRSRGRTQKKRQTKTIRLKTKDVEQQLPVMIGVSKAILDSVIFVHQEDANWPLSDSATLKKKFDDMFSAARYTKVLEYARNITKTNKKDLETLRAKLDHLNVRHRMIGVL